MLKFTDLGGLDKGKRLGYSSTGLSEGKTPILFEKGLIQGQRAYISRALRLGFVC